jgi:hypothetical protein
MSKSSDFEAMNIWRFESGAVAEHWIFFDQLGFLHQIGAIPSG